MSGRERGAGAGSWYRERGGVVLLWFAFLGGPVAWVLHLGTVYLLVPFTCGPGGAAWYHAATLAMLALSGSAAWAGLRGGRRDGDRAGPEPEAARGRARFMARAGVALGLLFSVVIAAQWIPPLVLGGCP